MAESEVRDPRQRALSAILAADVVRGARRVHHAHEVELAALERPGCLVRGRAGDLDAGDIARVGARVGLVAHEDEPRVAVLELPERAADDLSLGIRPVVAVALDRVLRQGAGIRTVDDAHEVRGGRDEPELDGPVVERPHADRLGVVAVAEEVLLAVLEHEVDRRGGPGPLGVEHSPDAEDPVVRGQRLPSDQCSPSRRWKT